MIIKKYFFATSFTVLPVIGSNIPIAVIEEIKIINYGKDIKSNSAILRDGGR